eukprot:14371325-Heterocapsa_arctica.AAC.1
MKGDPMSLMVQRGWMTCLPCPDPAAEDEARTLPEGTLFEPSKPSDGQCTPMDHASRETGAMRPGQAFRQCRSTTMAI